VTDNKKWTFFVGISGHTVVTVRALDEAEARRRARIELDRRYEKADREPPVGWDLTLKDVRE
jgi:hypothetical protein